MSGLTGEGVTLVTEGRTSLCEGGSIAFIASTAAALALLAAVAAAADSVVVGFGAILYSAVTSSAKALRLKKHNPAIKAKWLFIMLFLI